MTWTPSSRVLTLSEPQEHLKLLPHSQPIQQSSKKPESHLHGLRWAKHYSWTWIIPHTRHKNLFTAIILYDFKPLRKVLRAGMLFPWVRWGNQSSEHDLPKATWGPSFCHSLVKPGALFNKTSLPGFFQLIRKVFIKNETCGQWVGKDDIMFLTKPNFPLKKN